MDQSTSTDSRAIKTVRPVVFGEVLFDCFDDREVPGGAPLNVAWHLQALGWDPLLISRVGEDDQGRRITRRMQEWGMDTAGIQRDPAHPTGRVAVEMKEKGHAFHILEDQAYDYIESEAALRAVDGQSIGVLCHGSLALRAASKEAFRRLSGAIGAPVFLDINLRDPWWIKDAVLEMIHRADHLKLNEEELQLLLPESVKHEPLESAAVHTCSEWRLKTLWLTLGSQGAFSSPAGGESCRIPTVDGDLPVVDTVGAGDAFSAGLIGGLLKESEPRETAECASRLASRVCGQRGATAMDPGLYRGLGAVTNDQKRTRNVMPENTD
jgi:fructokinase